MTNINRDNTECRHIGSDNAARRLQGRGRVKKVDCLHHQSIGTMTS
jgi:hypothetical protein